MRTKISVLLLFFLVGGSGFLLAQHLKVEHDPQTDFSVFKTYAWLKGTHAPNPKVHERITQTIDEQLAAKGLKKVEDGQPDLYVVYHGAARDTIELDKLGYDWAGQPQVRTVKRATLVVDLLEAKMRTVVWRGMGGGKIDMLNPEDTREKAASMIREAFRQYPPQEK